MIIYNRHNDGVPKSAVYVGRGSPFGNPYRIGKDGNRAQVIIKFKDWVKTQPKLVTLIKQKLRGRDLVCYCAPNLCHAEVLMEIANGT